jgi:hypothetical protein
MVQPGKISEIQTIFQYNFNVALMLAIYSSLYRSIQLRSVLYSGSGSAHEF